MSVHLDVSNRESVLAQLAANRIDLGIMGQVPEGQDLDATRFMDNPLVVIGPPNHPLTRKKRITANDLAAEPFLVREAGSGTRGAMERYFATKGLVIHTSMDMSSNEAIKQAVQAGLGLGILSLHTLELELALKRLVLVKAEGFPIVRHWYITHRAVTPLVAAEVQRALDQLPDEFKLAVVLADVEDLTYEEISQIMGCPMGTVMSRLHRGRKLLQRSLYEHALSLGIVKAESEVENKPRDLAEYRRRKGAA